MKAIKYSILDLATVVQGDTIQRTFEKSREMAQHAEKLGFTRYWFSEHHNMESVASSATAVLIGYIAQHTSTMRIGSGGIMLPNHSPLMVAEQFGTLYELTPGRIDLGLGRAPGTDGATAMAIRGTHPGMPYNFKEHIEKLQQYFSKQNAAGQVRAIPGEGADIPLWILGSSTDSAYLAAEMGLPYAFASHFAPQQLMNALQIYKNGFKPSEQLKAPYTLACVNVVAGETNEEAAYLSTSMYQAFLGIITNERSPMKPPVTPQQMENIWTPEQKMYMLQMLSLALIGDENTIDKNLRYFIEQTGIDEVMISSPIFDIEKRKRSMEIFAGICKRVSLPAG